MNDMINKRWIALGVLVLVILVLFFLIFLPLLLIWMGSYQQTSELVFRLHRQQSVLEIKEDVSKNLADIKKQFQLQNYFSVQETESLASAELQNIIKMAVAQNGGQLVSTQGLPSESYKQLFKVIVSVRLVTNMEALASVLSYLESNNPVMVIDQLDISPIRSYKSNNAVNHGYSLNVNFKVFSFMRLNNNDL